MNPRQITPDLPVSALAELELADWQFMLAQIEQDPNGQLADVIYCKRQISRLTTDLNYRAGLFDAYGSNLPTLPDDAAGVIPEHELGLTKREYFAAYAMQGILAHPDSYTTESIALSAVEHADALINALNKPVQ